MKKQILILAIMIIGAGLYSCKKKYQIIPPPVPSSSIRDSLEFNFFDSIQYFTVNGLGGGDFVTNKGIVFTIPPYTFRGAAGDTILGDVNIDIVEILDPANMVLMNKTTTSDNEVLVTGGQFRINFTYNSSQVYISSDTVVYVGVPTDISSPNMKLFEGYEDATGFVNWKPVLDTLGQPVATPILTETVNGLFQDYYSFALDSLNSNWINCDYFYNSLGSKTQLSVTLGDKHDNSNTLFFIHFNNFQSVMAGYFDGQKFVTPGTVPVGANVSLLLFSEIDEEYAIKKIDMVVSNGYSLTTTLDPTTYKDLLNTIRNL
ncbi:hypothetical protein DNU06_01215 [Putridiphycobacter roseus]|uniref:Uncharacterized protein n=1 Tax=Putridiphycobacter roseus TaxID=2219161 RepID=A0A2W1N5R1_9FLAO|nr:hypothetical protein [Putridiphycobacter roseus]PZE18481.1 hypothetical protein DNU06_01215 [Putridiphycobacter roseus]